MHVSPELYGNCVIGLLPCGVTMPYLLTLPAVPIGSCFGLVAICGCGYVACLFFIAHYFESCCNVSSILW